MGIRFSIFDDLFNTAREVDRVANAKIVCAVVRRSNIIATGTNEYRTHPLQKRYGRNEDSIYLHAEVSAIINALKIIDHEELSKCSLYIARAKKVTKDSDWQYGLAKCCPGCERLIKKLKIKNVYYTTNTHGEVDIL